MKQGPEPGGPTIVHNTINTGDVQAFGITDQNYRPAVLRMLVRNDWDLGGLSVFQICVDEVSGVLTFLVEHTETGVFLSHNTVLVHSRNPLRIILETTILTPEISRGVLEMLADFEQVAAIALVRYGEA